MAKSCSLAHETVCGEPTCPKSPVADLQRQLQEAQEEAHGLYLAFMSTQAERDAAVGRAEAAEALALRIHKVCEHTLEEGRVCNLGWYRMVVFDIGQLTAPAEAQEDAAEQRALAEKRGEALRPFARHFIPSSGTTPGRLAKLDEVEPWSLEDFGRAYALTPAGAQEEILVARRNAESWQETAQQAQDNEAELVNDCIWNLEQCPGGHCNDVTRVYDRLLKRREELAPGCKCGGVLRHSCGPKCLALAGALRAKHRSPQSGQEEDDDD